MVGEACLPSNSYYPRTPDCTLYSGVNVCWSEHSDSSFVYGFMSLDYGLDTMTATTVNSQKKNNNNKKKKQKKKTKKKKQKKKKKKKKKKKNVTIVIYI